MTSRLRATELAIGRMRNRESAPMISVCDRIEELTLVFMEQPPTLPLVVEAGILAAVEREMRAVGKTPQS